MPRPPSVVCTTVDPAGPPAPDPSQPRPPPNAAATPTSPLSPVTARALEPAAPAAPRPTCGITRTEDRAVLRAEMKALAPWKQALALARKAGRPGRAGPAARCGPLAAAQAKPQTPELMPAAAAPPHRRRLPSSRQLRDTRPRAPVRARWQNPMHQFRISHGNAQSPATRNATFMRQGGDGTQSRPAPDRAARGPRSTKAPAG